MFSPDTILQSGGLLVVALVIFAETGLLFGIIFPGDSLLLAGGLLASQGKLSIEWLVGLTIVAAIAGYEMGYYIGQKSGPRVFRREEGLLFKKEYIERTEKFFKRHGGKTIIMARFVPYVRTFVPVVAGVGKMNRRFYTTYNIFGGILWAGGMTLASYWLGSNIPNFDKYIIITVVASLVIFHAIIFWHLLHNSERRKRLKEDLRKDWDHLFGKNKN